MRIDGVMLERLLQDGGQEAGSYAASHRIYAGLNNLGYLFSLLLFPMFIRWSKKKNQLLNLLHESTISLITLGGTAVILILAYRSEVMGMLYKEDAMLYGHTALSLLMYTFLMACLVHVFGTLLTARKQFRAFIGMLFLSAGANVVMNFYYIPKTGMIGACWSTLASHAILSFGLITVLREEMMNKIFLSKLIKLSSYLVIVILVTNALKEVMSTSYWIVPASLSLFISMVLCLRTKLFGTFLLDIGKDK